MERKLEGEAGMEVGFSRWGELFILIGWEIQGREEDGWSQVLEEGGRKGSNAEVEGLVSDTRRDSLFTEIGGKEERMGPDR